MRLRTAWTLLGLVIGFDLAILFGCLAIFAMVLLTASVAGPPGLLEVSQFRTVVRSASVIIPMVFVAICLGSVWMGYRRGLTSEARLGGSEFAEVARVRAMAFRLGLVSVGVSLLMIVFLVVRYLQVAGGTSGG